MHPQVLEFNYFSIADVQLRRDEESDEDGWQERETSRTFSVKFPDDLDTEKEDMSKEVFFILE